LQREDTKYSKNRGKGRVRGKGDRIYEKSSQPPTSGKEDDDRCGKELMIEREDTYWKRGGEGDVFGCKDFDHHSIMLRE